jgi:predicted DNA-binding transcriptional regulator AlpA
MNDGMTLAELLAMPVMVDITTASRALGLGRSTGYELARRGEFPCRVLHVGSSYRVPTAELLHTLGIDLSELCQPLSVRPARTERISPPREARFTYSTDRRTERRS